MSRSTRWQDALTDLAHFLRLHSRKAWYSPSQCTSSEFYPVYTLTLPEDVVEIHHVGAVQLPKLLALAKHAIDLMQQAGLRTPLSAKSESLDPRHRAYNLLLELYAAAEQAQAIMYHQGHGLLTLPENPETYATTFSDAVQAQKSDPLSNEETQSPTVVTPPGGPSEATSTAGDGENAGEKKLSDRLLQIKALYEWSLKAIPGAETMRIRELYSAIKAYGQTHIAEEGYDVAELLPPSPEAFGKALRRAGVRRYQRASKPPTTRSVVRRDQI